MRIAIMTTEHGHYHNARLRAAHRKIDDLHVLFLSRSAEFQEYLGEFPEDLCCYPTSPHDYGQHRWVSDALDQINPDCVVISGWSRWESFEAIKWAVSQRRALVIQSASQFVDFARSALVEFIKSRIVGLCHGAIVGGEPHRQYAIRLGLDPSTVFVGVDVVDNDWFATNGDLARNASAGDLDADMPSKRFFVCSARFIRKKNILFMIDAFADAFGDDVDGPDLAILGDGPERASIEQRVAERGLTGRVIAPGFKSYQQLPSYYARSLGLVLASTSEQWGLVVNEACAAGAPVIVSSRCGAASALVRDGWNGFVVDPSDKASLVSAFRRLASLSDEERATWGGRSREIVSHWTPDLFARNLQLACEAAVTRAGLRRPSVLGRLTVLGASSWRRLRK